MYSALRFYHCANIPASTVPSHVPRSHGSALRFRSFRLRLTSQTVPTLLHSPSSCGSVSQSRQSRLCFTSQTVPVPFHSPGNHNSASQPKQSQPQHSASQSRHSQLRLTTQAVTVQAFRLPAPAVSVRSHSTIQIKYSFPSSLIFCRDFWILMRI